MVSQTKSRLEIEQPLRQTQEYVPSKTQELMELDDNTEERENTIRYALWVYGFLLEKNIPFRLCHLAQKIRQSYDCKKNRRNELIADLLTLNSNSYAPFLRTNSCDFVQIYEPQNIPEEQIRFLSN